MEKLRGPGGQEVTPFSPRVVDAVREQAPLPGELRGCRDCKYRTLNICTHPSVGRRRLNVFTGKVVVEQQPKLEVMRSPNGACGLEGRFWKKAGVQSNYRSYRTLTFLMAAACLYLTYSVTWWALLLVIPTAILALIWASLASEP